MPRPKNKRTNRTSGKKFSEPSGILSELAKFNILDEEGFANEGKKSLPEWVEIIPDDEIVRARDGRGFQNSEPQEIINNFERDAVELQIDVDHIAAEGGGFIPRKNPAYGWIDKLEIFGKQGIRGHVRMWTKLGQEALGDELYKYSSPWIRRKQLYQHDDEDAPRDDRGEVLMGIVKINNLSLVNQPALYLEAVASQEFDAEEEQETRETPDTKEETMDKAILEALGLPGDATATQALTALFSLKAKANTEVDPKQFTPTADYLLQLENLNKAKAELETLKAEHKAVTEASFNAEVDVFIQDLLTRKVIAPASEAFHRKSITSKEALEEFRTLTASMPSVVPEVDLPSAKPPGAQMAEFQMGAYSKKVMKDLGLTKEELAKAQQRINEAGGLQ